MGYDGQLLPEPFSFERSYRASYNLGLLNAPREQAVRRVQKPGSKRTHEQMRRLREMRAVHRS